MALQLTYASTVPAGADTVFVLPASTRELPPRLSPTFPRRPETTYTSSSPPIASLLLSITSRIDTTLLLRPQKPLLSW
ncbi:hypothetical protein [Hymenobacter sp. HDW8]|uniref:hypothetical protein n=1 Tax=Hymenobacter sp. HDW8 TaxID=2714932 RepID=UPI001F0F46EB|nr:hypothetical protein [Hymenobacter sp. HDW8]